VTIFKTEELWQQRWYVIVYPLELFVSWTVSTYVPTSTQIPAGGTKQGFWGLAGIILWVNNGSPLL